MAAEALGGKLLGEVEVGSLEEVSFVCFLFWELVLAWALHVVDVIVI